MGKVRFSVVGYGNIGSRHVHFLGQLPGAELISICDIKKERAEEGAAKAGCKALTDYQEVLADPEVDVVDICTPSGLHAAMSVKAMKAGKHAISEKPMALSLKDADEVLKVQKKTDKRYFLVKQNRYNPPVAALRKVVEDGSIGKVLFISSNVFWNRRRGYYEEEPWRGTLALDGGALFTQSSHFIDLLLWLGGKPLSVESYMANLSHEYTETEDTGSVRIELEGGGLAVMNYTTSTYHSNLEGSITVLGTNGTVKVGGKYLNELVEWNVEGVPRPDLPPGGPPNTYKGGYQGSMSNHDKVLQNVIDVLNEGKQVAVSLEEGRLTVEVMQAAHISALEGKKVVLPLKGKHLGFELSNTQPFPSRERNR